MNYCNLWLPKFKKKNLFHSVRLLDAKHIVFKNFIQLAPTHNRGYFNALYKVSYDLTTSDILDKTQES